MGRCIGWCGYCYEGLKGRRFHRGHFGYRPAKPYREEAVGSVLKRRIEGGVSPGEGGDIALCPVLGQVPGVREMLVETRFPDGSARQTSTLLLFVEAGVVKVCLNDRDQGMSAWASGSSVLDCLLALESGLQADTLQWRASGPRRGGKRGK